MRDPRLDALAGVIVHYSTRIKEGDLVEIAAEADAFPLVEAMYEACVKAGAHPFWSPKSERLTEILLTHGTDAQIGMLSELSMFQIEKIDARLSIWSPVNTRFLGRVDPRKIALNQSARRPYLKRFMERAAREHEGKPGGLRWCGTAFPTSGSAQDAEMSLAQYAEFVFRAGMLHLPDPIAEWKRVHERQERVREYLQGKSAVRFCAPACDGHDGTDLTVDVSKATWINCSGRENFPDGEVFAGPTGVDGRVNYTFPAVYEGREVEGVRLVFRAGRVVEASARKNEEFLFAMLDQDPGARTLGEIAIGTNYSITGFTRDTLFDEKIGGTFHAAVGAGYPESGSTNESALHWDMVCDLRPDAARKRAGGTIEADGEVFHRDGMFTRPGWPGRE